MADTIKWGIISTGGIAQQFAAGLAEVPDATLVAVGSRSQTSADRFGDQFGVPNRHPSYEALVNDPDVDIVYIGTPHPMHEGDVRLALEAGKHVLNEKPFTINAGQTEGLIQLATEKKLFMMEAMWMRFIPTIVKLHELVNDGAIGMVRGISADFGFMPDYDPAGRLFDIELGGGALLDIGIYPITFAVMLLGLPDAHRSLPHMGPTGVDEQFSASFFWNDGRVASLIATLRANSTCEAWVFGDKGRIRVHSQFWHPQRLTLIRNGKEEIIDVPMVGNGYNYEAQEAMRCIREGKLQSDIWSMEKTLGIMQLMDAMRADWGFKYPGE